MINSVIKNIFFHSISIFFKNLTKNNFSFSLNIENVFPAFKGAFIFLSTAVNTNISFLEKSIEYFTTSVTFTSPRSVLSVYSHLVQASPASHSKKVSSTYTRYACGTFLPNSPPRMAVIIALRVLPRQNSGMKKVQGRTFFIGLFPKVLLVGRFSKFKSLVPDVLPNGKTRSSKVPKQL